MEVSGQSTENKVDFYCRVDLVKLRFKRGFKEVEMRFHEYKWYKYTK